MTGIYDCTICLCDQTVTGPPSGMVMIVRGLGGRGVGAVCTPPFESVIAVRRSRFWGSASLGYGEDADGDALLGVLTISRNQVRRVRVDMASVAIGEEGSEQGRKRSLGRVLRWDGRVALWRAFFGWILAAVSGMEVGEILGVPRCSECS